MSDPNGKFTEEWRNTLSRYWQLARHITTWDGPMAHLYDAVLHEQLQGRLYLPECFKVPSIHNSTIEVRLAWSYVAKCVKVAEWRPVVYRQSNETREHFGMRLAKHFRWVDLDEIAPELRDERAVSWWRDEIVEAKVLLVDPTNSRYVETSLLAATAQEVTYEIGNRLKRIPDISDYPRKAKEAPVESVHAEYRNPKSASVALTVDGKVQAGKFISSGEWIKEFESHCWPPSAIKRFAHELPAEELSGFYIINDDRDFIELEEKLETPKGFKQYVQIDNRPKPPPASGTPVKVRLGWNDGLELLEYRVVDDSPYHTLYKATEMLKDYVDAKKVREWVPPYMVRGQLPGDWKLYNVEVEKSVVLVTPDKWTRIWHDDLPNFNGALETLGVAPDAKGNVDVWCLGYLSGGSVFVPREDGTMCPVLFPGKRKQDKKLINNECFVWFKVSLAEHLGIGQTIPPEKGEIEATKIFPTICWREGESLQRCRQRHQGVWDECSPEIALEHARKAPMAWVKLGGDHEGVVIGNPSSSEWASIKCYHDQRINQTHHDQFINQIRFPPQEHQLIDNSRWLWQLARCVGGDSRKARLVATSQEIVLPDFCPSVSKDELVEVVMGPKYCIRYRKLAYRKSRMEEGTCVINSGKEVTAACALHDLHHQPYGWQQYQIFNDTRLVANAYEQCHAFIHNDELDDDLRWLVGSLPEIFVDDVLVGAALLSRAAHVSVDPTETQTVQELRPETQQTDAIPVAPAKKNDTEPVPKPVEHPDRQGVMEAPARRGPVERWQRKRPYIPWNPEDV